MSTREYLVSIENYLKAIVATQAFQSAEMKRLEARFDALHSEMKSNYVGIDGLVRAAIAPSTKA